MAMRSRPVTATIALVVFLAGGSSSADSLRSRVAFNTAIQQRATEQPLDGVAMHYPVTLVGGELDGCEVQIAESLFPRDEGSWGIFQVVGDVECGRGGFAFTSSGAWDGQGFHGAGLVTEGTGTGLYEGLAGRVAQIGGALTPAGTAGAFDVRYDLLVDRASD
jgi:hypothetical protein